MAKLDPKWADVRFVVVEPKSETTGNFSIETGKLHVIGDGQGAVQASLPSPVSGMNAYVKAFIADLDTNTVVVVPQGGAKIEGVAGNYSMSAQNQTLHFVTDGTDWFIL